jgi:hypothetical protein
MTISLSDISEAGRSIVEPNATLQTASTVESTGLSSGVCESPPRFIEMARGISTRGRSTVVVPGSRLVLEFAGLPNDSSPTSAEVGFWSQLGLNIA